MVRITMMLIALLVAGAVVADDKAKQEPAKKAPTQSLARKAGEGKEGAAGAKSSDPKALAGISILGNQDSPKSLVIVPWKGSQIGDMPGLSRLLDDSVQPVDKDVFMRELSYYEIRAGK
jgi:hypothetical protein